MSSEIRSKYKIYPLQNLKSDKYKHANYIRQAVKDNKWAKAYLQNRPGLRDYFTLDLPFYAAIANSLQRISQDVAHNENPDYLYHKHHTKTDVDVERSIGCSNPNCKPGYYHIWKQSYSSTKTFRRVKMSFCLKCASNYIKPDVGPSSCTPCTNDTRSNQDNTKCIYHGKIFMRSDSTRAKAMYILIVLGSLLTLSVALVFVKYKNTPVIKFSVQNLSFVQLIGHLMLNLVLLRLIDLSRNDVIIV